MNAEELDRLVLKRLSVFKPIKQVQYKSCVIEISQKDEDNFSFKIVNGEGKEVPTIAASYGSVEEALNRAKGIVDRSKLSGTRMGADELDAVVMKRLSRR